MFLYVVEPDHNKVRVARRHDLMLKITIWSLN